MPFSIFNINEILIYGLPIIFNRRLLLPFICVPLINILISFLALNLFSLELPATSIGHSWITPVFINGYFAAGANILVFMLQLFLLFLGTLIYIPFVREYTKSQSGLHHSKLLSEKLNVQLFLKSEQEIKANKAIHSIIQSNEEVEKIINLLDEDRLLVYYQPKVNIETGLCNHFEALLRIKMPDDSVKGPYFLPYIESAGLAAIIDFWVCQQVNQNMLEWKNLGFAPTVGINLHPDTLARTDIILKIMKLHHGHKIDFEIIERGLLDNESAIENIRLLKERGFTISVDDFGTGYSNLETLTFLSVDTLKIDKSITDLIHTKKGFIICKNILSLCEEMNFHCVVEGVETKEQITILLGMGVKYVQGYYYSPAIAARKAHNYVQNL